MGSSTGARSRDLPVELATRLVTASYPISDPRLERLDGEHDHNFVVLSAEGRFLLKVMRPGCSLEFVDLQQSALAHVVAKIDWPAVPRVCRSTQDQAVVTMADAAGEERLVWMLDWIPGRLLADVAPRTAAVLRELGRAIGAVGRALDDFDHQLDDRDLPWDLGRAEWIGDHLDLVDEPRRRLVDRMLTRYRNEVVPALGDLREAWIHGDANDHNVIVTESAHPTVVGLVDFGDMVRSRTVFDVAIAAAYALLGEADPVAAGAHVIAGHHEVSALEPEEVDLLYALIGMRLSVSAITSARRKLESDDPYVTISEKPVWQALERLDQVPGRYARYAFRAACEWPAVPHAVQVIDDLSRRGDEMASVVGRDLRWRPVEVLDLGVGSRWLGADPGATETASLTRGIFDHMATAGVDVGIGRYGEARLLHTDPSFSSGDRVVEERRTIHLGVDLFVASGTEVRSPLEGIVHILADNARAQAYGPLVVIRHETEAGVPFYTLYGHLDAAALDQHQVGDRIDRGEVVGRVGTPPGNGDWPPHLHFQLVTDLLGLDAGFPGVAYASQMGVWGDLSPDPNVILGIPAERFPPVADGAALLARRRSGVGYNLSVSYDRPLTIVRGWRQYLYDETGRAYLDLYNNVAHVGHSHPRVVAAVQEQVALLNTNTRYLHENLVRYAERLASRMPAPLEVCFVLNSASEANELAIRLARAHTGEHDTIVLDAAYHGHTTTLIDLSPYKFDGPGGRGAPDWVHTAPIPDDYRGPYKRGDPEAGRRYAGHIGERIAEVNSRGRGLAALITETLPSVGGQIIPPAGYLAAAYDHVRRAGGVCIADEVQVGFGRPGTHFWGFEAQQAVPDIVVLGKPIGNGFPVAAVVTTAEIARSFDNGMEFFSTFGGNPVACAAGLAVLDVVEEEGLQENAARVGAELLSGLAEIMDRHEVVGDVRGLGLFAGIEFVRDRETREPAPEIAARVVDRLRECGVLVGTDGPYHNVIKIKPPMILEVTDVEVALSILDSVLDEDGARLWGGA